MTHLQIILTNLSHYMLSSIHLYMQVITELVMAGQTIPKDFKDKKGATDYVVQYLNAGIMLTILNDQQA